MINRTSLDGNWKLYYYDKARADACVRSPDALAGLEPIPAAVPGNAELDLARAGIIDADLFFADNTEKNYRFENYYFWYTRDFELDDTDAKELKLRFGGVDMLADYYINGTLAGSSENALTEYVLDIKPFAKRGKNTLHVCIKPIDEYINSNEYSEYLCSRADRQSFARKSAHSFGWDIFPRALSAGITRSVTLEANDGIYIDEFAYRTDLADAHYAEVRFTASFKAPSDFFGADTRLVVHGKCSDRKGSSEFRFEETLTHKSMLRTLGIGDPKLWWPAGYGEPSLYDTTVELWHKGTLCDSRRLNVGVRTAKLVRTESLLCENHDFCFVINGVRVLCKGSNHVPLDAYHSRIAERYEKAIALYTDTHSNILRVWGGGIYEDDRFYTLCDQNGIMVWQDFMMACIPMSQDEHMYSLLKAEFTAEVKRLRNHASIVLWSGDNEIDELLAYNKIRPSVNRLTRELLPSVLAMHDPTRAYLESSPYIPDSLCERYPDADVFCERHLWGARDYYKADFYSHSKAHFVSETGYHGAPCLESIKKTVSPEAVWPIFNSEWALHSSDQKGSLHRVRLMWDQIKQLFAFEPDNIEDFILASQISQAEAKKYFVERVRIKRPYTTGIIWWNMLDGWPQMSDAVVDYFFEKKLAYHYIKAAQQPVVLMLDEMHDWHYPIVADNTTLTDAHGSYCVYDIESGKRYAEGEFDIAANTSRVIGRVNGMYYSDKAFLVLEYTLDNKVYFNHHLCGYPGFDFEKYRAWLEKYKALTDGFTE